MRRRLCVLGAAALLLSVGSAAFAQQPEPAGPTPTAPEIAGKMTVVVDDLAKKETGEPVQKQQKAVVRDLDALIKSLERQASRRRGNIAQNDPRMPATGGTHGGTGGVGDLVDPNDSQKDWAKLSARERDRILQSMSEGFPPEYRQVLERYYRRLAEEKTIKAGSGDAAEPKAAAPQSK